MSLGGSPGATVMVIGTGGVGSNVIQVCKAFGAAKIIAVDIDDTKLEMAMSMGATHVINSKTSDKSVPERVVDIVGKAKGISLLDSDRSHEKFEYHPQWQAPQI